MNSVALRYTAVVLAIAACADNTAPVSGPDYDRKWFEGSVVVVEDIQNPCNGETIHMTSQLIYADAFNDSGREFHHLRVAGSGVSDNGTQYALRSLTRASALPHISEKVSVHEVVSGSVLGSSFRREVVVQLHLDGTGGIHEVFNDRGSCR